MSQDRRTITVALGERSYDIVIQPGLIKDAGALIAARVKGRRCLMLSDQSIGPLHGTKLAGSISAAGIGGNLILLPPGEQCKSLRTAESLYDQCLAAGLDRDSFLVALGGGVIGDLTGFVAATYFRGIPFVQVPTTLLAMVDAAIGGKTGVDLPSAKNAVGAFHQPRAVLIDPETLSTLPRRDLKAGLAEVIKYGVIDDAALFEFLEQNVARLLDASPEALAHVIEKSAGIKARIVSQDEREQAGGPRALLNFGHTFGHALESSTGYSAYLHGEAVAIGMCMAANLSVKLGLLSLADRDRIVALIRKAELPIKLMAGDPDTNTLYAAMFKDKKAAAGKLRFVVAEKIGRAKTVGDVPEAMVREVLDQAR
ncbi:MAG TPA: 3-dehydroquinate synthase [Planctomycetota bacterium]|nr:3-dehydroquinate synthase [Planctomycetota bacterium]